MASPTVMSMHMHSTLSASRMASMSSMDPASGMSGMSSTFSASTRVTLWFTDWTTTSTTTYVLTMLFLFFLGMFNRFLGALRSQLEKMWSRQRKSSPPKKAAYDEKEPSTKIRGHARQWSHSLRVQTVRLQEPTGQELEPLSPAIQVEEGGVKERIHTKRRFWAADAPRSIKQDGISALLEFTRALIGYVLMLAVMTFNIGILLAVTGSVLLGELLFGRYMRGSMAIAEDSCHS